MKIINDSNASKRMFVAVLFGIAFAFVSLFLQLLIFAFIMLKFDASSNVSSIFATIALMISSLIAGLVSSKKLGFKVLFTAVISGALFYFLVAIISAAITKNTFGALFLLRMSLCILASVIGVLIGLKKNNKII